MSTFLSQKQLAATQTQEVEEIDKAVHAKEVTKDKEVGEKVEEIARVSQTVEEDARGYKGIQGDVVEIDHLHGCSHSVDDAG